MCYLHFLTQLTFTTHKAHQIIAFQQCECNPLLLQVNFSKCIHRKVNETLRQFIGKWWWWAAMLGVPLRLRGVNYASNQVWVYCRWARAESVQWVHCEERQALVDGKQSVLLIRKKKTWLIRAGWALGPVGRGLTSNKPCLLLCPRNWKRLGEF